MKVWVLVEAIDLGDRVWGVFLDEPSAQGALEKLVARHQQRYGFSEERVRGDLSIDEMTTGELSDAEVVGRPDEVTRLHGEIGELNAALEYLRAKVRAQRQ